MIKTGKLHDPYLPPELVERVTRAGGKHSVYNLPLYRIVWGQKRLHWVGGNFEREGFVGAIYEPRYHGDAAEKWILERFVPNEMTRDEWHEQYHRVIDGIPVDTQGPYPELGDYEEVISFPHEVATSPYWYDLVLEGVRIAREAEYTARRRALLDKIEKDEKDWEANADALLSDVPRSYLRPNVVVPNNFEGSS